MAYTHQISPVLHKGNATMNDYEDNGKLTLNSTHKVKITRFY